MTARRLALLLAAVLVVGGAAASWRLVGQDPPPGLTPAMLARMDQLGLGVAPDDAATRELEDTARDLAGRLGGTEAEPDRRVRAVALATVTERDRGSEDRLWVVWVEGVPVRCFGGHDCEPGTGSEVVLVDPETLEPERSIVF